MPKAPTVRIPTIAVVAAAVIFLALTTPSVHAAGLSAATGAATDFRGWLYGFVGVIGGIFLLYRGVMAWANKIQWIDLAMDVAKVAVAGGSIVGAAYAYSVFA